MQNKNYKRNKKTYSNRSCRLKAVSIHIYIAQVVVLKIKCAYILPILLDRHFELFVYKSFLFVNVCALY